jgi:hypothetical protein
MKVEYNKANKLSKWVSLVLLLGILPLLVFYIGREYQKTVSVYDTENGNGVTNYTTKDHVFSKRESQPSKVFYNSGVRGMATVGPNCPVMRADNEAECADKPVSVDIKFINQYGSATTTTSAADGSFSIMLEPGDYTITSGAERIYPALSPVSVTVNEGEYVKIDLSFDSGIR